MFEFLKYKSTLYPLERTLIDEVMKITPKCYAKKLCKQIESVNSIQRHSEFKEVNMYRMRKGKAFESENALPYAELEHVICTIDFMCLDSGSTLKMKAWLVEGWLFQLSFNRSPKQFRMCNDVLVKKKKSGFSDLVNQITPGEQDQLNNIQQLKDLIGEYTYSQVNSPISKNDMELFIAEFDSSLPDDYIQLISYANGFMVDDWSVFGLVDIRHVVGKDANWYILAETIDTYLTIHEGSDNVMLFILKHDQNAVDAGNSFITAIKQFLE